MSVPENKDIRLEYERLLRAVHQRLEVERTFGMSHVPMAKKTKARPATEKTVPQEAPAPVPAASAEALSKADALAQLRQECEKCMRCQLAKTRTNMVFGTGSPDAGLMFVGEAQIGRAHV